MVVALGTLWPPALKDAFLAEWHPWLQSELQREQNQTTPRVPLYHYTGKDAAEGILRTERLWCFSHLHQSDKTEFSYSLRIARDIIRQVGGSAEWFQHIFVCI
jgi:hypothetical protein